MCVAANKKLDIWFDGTCSGTMLACQAKLTTALIPDRGRATGLCTRRGPVPGSRGGRVAVAPEHMSVDQYAGAADAALKIYPVESAC
jgi:hypothetical protein